MQSEIDFLGMISHPNLVKLLGYCCDDVEFLLVYEFMPKGSLENHLFWSMNLRQLKYINNRNLLVALVHFLCFLFPIRKYKHRTALLGHSNQNSYWCCSGLGLLAHLRKANHIQRFQSLQHTT